jgi:hypothetical protein
MHLQERVAYIFKTLEDLSLLCPARLRTAKSSCISPGFYPYARPTSQGLKPRPPRRYCATASVCLRLGVLQTSPVQQLIQLLQQLS